MALNDGVLIFRLSLSLSLGKGDKLLTVLCHTEFPEDLKLKSVTYFIVQETEQNWVNYKLNKD